MTKRYISNIGEVLGVLDPKTVVLSYNSVGGTGPKAVNAMLRQFEADLEKHKQALSTDKVSHRFTFLEFIALLT